MQDLRWAVKEKELRGISHRLSQRESKEEPASNGAGKNCTLSSSKSVRWFGRWYINAKRIGHGAWRRTLCALRYAPSGEAAGRPRATTWPAIGPREIPRAGPVGAGFTRESYSWRPCPAPGGLA